MKKFIILLSVCVVGAAQLVPVKISEYPRTTTVSDNDLMLYSFWAGGGYTTNKALTFTNLVTQLQSIISVGGFSTGLGITNVSGTVSNNIIAGSNVIITAGAYGQLSIASTSGGSTSLSVITNSLGVFADYYEAGDGDDALLARAYTASAGRGRIILSGRRYNITQPWFIGPNNTNSLLAGLEITGTSFGTNIATSINQATAATSSIVLTNSRGIRIDGILFTSTTGTNTAIHINTVTDSTIENCAFSSQGIGVRFSQTNHTWRLSNNKFLTTIAGVLQDSSSSILNAVTIGPRNYITSLSTNLGVGIELSSGSTIIFNGQNTIEVIKDGVILNGGSTTFDTSITGVHFESVGQYAIWGGRSGNLNGFRVSENFFGLLTNTYGLKIDNTVFSSVIKNNALSPDSATFFNGADTIARGSSDWQRGSNDDDADWVNPTSSTFRPTTLFQTGGSFKENLVVSSNFTANGNGQIDGIINWGGKGTLTQGSGIAVIRTTNSTDGLIFQNGGNNALTITNTFVGIGTTAPTISAILDVASTTRGILAPRMTEAQVNAIVTPATGLNVFETDTLPGPKWYFGSAWNNAPTHNHGSVTNGGLLTAASFASLGTGLGITNIGGVISNNIVAGANVTITAGSSGQLSIASSGGAGASILVNGAAIGSPNFLDGSTATFTVAAITNVTVNPTNIVNAQIAAAAAIALTKINTSLAQVNTTNLSNPGIMTGHRFVGTNEIVTIASFQWDGGDSALSISASPGNKVRYWRVKDDFLITGVTFLSDVSASAVVDIWKDTYANYPPTVADTITASDKPTLSTANKYEDDAPTGWTTTVTAGDVFAAKLDSTATATWLIVQIHGRKR